MCYSNTFKLIYNIFVVNVRPLDGVSKKIDGKTYLVITIIIVIWIAIIYM